MSKRQESLQKYTAVNHFSTILNIFVAVFIMKQQKNNVTDKPRVHNGVCKYFQKILKISGNGSLSPTSLIMTD